MFKKKKRYRAIIDGKLFDSLNATLVYEQKYNGLAITPGEFIKNHLFIYKTVKGKYVKIIDRDYGTSISYKIIPEHEYAEILKKYDLDLYLERFGPLEEL